MTGWEAGLDWALAALAVAGIVYTLAAAWAVGVRLNRRRTTAETSYAAAAVTVVKPLHGAPDGLADAMEGFCRQDYPGAVQILFGVQDGADPAIPMVEALKRRHADMDIALVVDSRLHGANRKVSNLVNIVERARHDLLVISDADIRVEPDYLRRVVSALAHPGVGAVTCLYAGRSNGRPAARLAAMGIDYHFLPSAVLGMMIGLARPCFGSTIALRRDTLERIGGLAAFAGHLADDYEIGRAIRALGLAVAVPPMTVVHHCDETSARELIGHELRWALTTRRIDPLGYAGSVITHPTPLALIAAVMAGFAPWSVALIVASLTSRLILKRVVDGATGAKAGPAWLMAWRDTISLGVFLLSFAVRSVGWRGHRFRVGPGGILLQG